MDSPVASKGFEVLFPAPESGAYPIGVVELLTVDSETVNCWVSKATLIRNVAPSGLRAQL